VAELIFADDAADPGHHLSDPGVDPWVLCLGTPDAPGHDADLGALAPKWAAEEGTAAVTLNKIKIGNVGKIQFFNFCNFTLQI
jgi:hypothetical protein